MTARLRELAEGWKGGTASHDYEMGRQECADELLSVLDAEGDGEAVAEVGRDWTLHWIGHGPIAPIINKHNIRIGDKLYPHPARSGVVSDEDVDVVAKMIADRVGNGMREKYEETAKQIVEHFAKGERHV